MIHLITSSTAACSVCVRSLESAGIHWAPVARSNGPSGRGGGGGGGVWCPPVHTSLFLSSLPAILLSPPSPLPSLSSPAPHALPLAERWDSFTEAARCQERSSPRKAGQMYVGHCESEGGFSFSSSLLFSPPFCSFVLFGSLARSFSPHEWKDNIDLCQSRLLFSWPNR